MSQLYMMQGDSFFDIDKFSDAVFAYEKSLQYDFIQGVKDNYELAKNELNT
jgi:hypothetical protein